MSTDNGNVDISSMFGLTEKQTKILFSIEKLLVLNDIIYSKDNKITKQKWLSEWSASVTDCLTKAPHNEPVNFMTRGEILSAIAQENSTNINNKKAYKDMKKIEVKIKDKENEDDDDKKPTNSN
ncbi:MAG: hypothetical protein PHV32_01810 [Eubacteriales bacterium]|nr:hypothetical protein [Eubacteriales bacterium]